MIASLSLYYFSTHIVQQQIELVCLLFIHIDHMGTPSTNGFCHLTLGRLGERLLRKRLEQKEADMYVTVSEKTIIYFVNSSFCQTL